MSLAEIQSAIEALPLEERAALMDWLAESQLGGADADSDWRAVGMKAFAAAYCPEDEVYERLMDDASR